MNIAWISSSLPYLPVTGGFGVPGSNLIPLLARRHRLDLISFLRPGDETHLDWPRQYCSSVELLRVKQHGYAQRLANFLSGYLWGRYLNHRRELEAILRRGLQSRSWDVLHVEGGFVAGLIPEDIPLPKVLAVHDAEVLRAQELLRCKLSLRARLNFTVRRFYEPRYGRLAYPRFDQCVMVADRDVAFNRNLIPKANFCMIPNGTDCQYYQPLEVKKIPLRVAFHGNLSYAPNVDAALEFANNILPILRHEQPEITFHLVGATPAKCVQELASRPGIKLSANLPDLRAALSSATVYVSALRHGTGIKNKILEAMALQLPIVCYEGSISGISCTPGKHLLVADSSADFAAKVLALFNDSGRLAQIAQAARDFVTEKYSWETCASAYEQIYARLAAGRQPATALVEAAS